MSDFGLPAGEWRRDPQTHVMRFIPDPPKTRQLQPCGTAAAYLRHARNGENPCGQCRQANALARSKRRNAA